MDPPYSGRQEQMQRPSYVQMPLHKYESLARSNGVSNALLQYRVCLHLPGCHLYTHIELPSLAELFV